MRESNLQSSCIEWLRKHDPNALIANIHGGGWSIKGFPDLLICINGRFITCELKVGNNSLEPAQKIWKQRIVKAGGHWYEIRTLENFKEVIEHEKSI